MKIHVTPLARVAEMLSKGAPDRVVSLLAPGQEAPEVSCSGALRLRFHDIAAPQDGLTAASPADVAQLVDFARNTPRSGAILVHCWFAVSRSPAAALAIGCAVAPRTCEAELARRLRQASPTCTPNPRLIALADAHLGRGGRLVEAVRAMGRGETCAVGEPFTLEV